MSSDYTPSENNGPTHQPPAQTHSDASQQAAYGSDPNAPESAPPVPGRKGPLALLFTGIGVGIIGVLLMVVALGTSVGGAVTASQEQETLNSGEPYTLAADPETKYAIYIDSSDFVQCYAENDAEEALLIDAPSSELVLNNRERVLTVTTGSADTSMKLVCETDNGADYYIGKAVSGEVDGAIVPLVAGSVAAFIGFFLTIGGIIWLIVRNGKIKRIRSGAVQRPY